MTRIACIDLDGVVANVDARFAQAEEAKQAFLVQKIAEKSERFQRTEIGWSMETVEKQAADLYWRTVFTPELVRLDTLIEGAKAALEELRFTHKYELFFLTSRPESMRGATLRWLLERNILFFLPMGQTALLMKAPAFQYTKTVTWKAGIIQTLAALYEAEEVLVIDDEQANSAEIEKYRAVLPPLTTAKSLAEALAKLDGTWVEPDPFVPDYGEER